MGRKKPEIPEAVMAEYRLLEQSGSPLRYIADATGSEKCAIRTDAREVYQLHNGKPGTAFSWGYSPETDPEHECWGKYRHSGFYGSGTLEITLECRVGWCCEGKLYASETVIKGKQTGDRLRKPGTNIYNRSTEDEIYLFETETECKPPVPVEKICRDILFADTAGCPGVQLQFRTAFHNSVQVLSASEDMPCELFFMAPELEQLYKTGYTGLVQAAADAYRKHDLNRIEMFNRLCRPGTKPKDIFKCPKEVYTALRTCSSLERWDIFRRCVRTGKISAECVTECYNRNYSEEILNKMARVVAMHYGDKPVFNTWNALQNLLDRADIYQGLEPVFALDLIADYIRCCNTLETPPRLDTDSLQREHDVAARNCRYKGDSRYREAMVPACAELQRLNWSNGIFFIRGIRSFEDLLQEARGQRNCVASYADWIADRTVLLFTMRRCCAPEQTMVTVQLSADRKRIEHALMAYNKPIHNRAMTEFLEQWLSFVRRGGVSDTDKVFEMADMLGYTSGPSPEEQVRFRDRCYAAQDLWYRSGSLSDSVEKVFGR